MHDDVIKWKHFPRYWPFVRGIHPAVPVNFPRKGHWRGALMYSLICVWINGWVNNRGAGDLRRHRGHYDVIVMIFTVWGLKKTDDILRYSHSTALSWMKAGVLSLDIHGILFLTVKLSLSQIRFTKPTHLRRHMSSRVHKVLTSNWCLRNFAGFFNKNSAIW